MEGRIVKGIWIPIEIWEADDLSWNEKILLMEIDSYTTKGKDCFISDEYISELLGINATNANRTLSSLIKKGYVIKTRFDGRKRYVESRAALPKTTEQPCRKQQHTNNNILNNSSTKNNNISIENGKFDFYQALLEMGVSPQVAKDFMAVRKEKKAKDTQTAIKGLQREIAKSGMTAEECITISVENSWKGFKVEWLDEKKPMAQRRQVPETNFQKLMKVGQEMFGGINDE